MNLIKNMLGAVALAAGLVAPVLAADDVPHRIKPPFPVLTLPEHASAGQRAIDLLGTRLPDVAAHYGKSPDEFRALMLNDRRLRLDRRGRLFVVEEQDAPLPITAPTTAAASGLVDGTLAPLDQTFLLHSRAGAKRTIYLNFKGATLTGTAWNASGAGTINAAPYDIDGIPGSFSTTELQRIQYIWQRVSEDYSPFDVDVTTEAPTQDKLTRSSSTDDVFGTTVVITNRTGVYSCSCGGVAYVGVFDDTSDYNKPALVFYDALGAGDEKYVAEAISHEAGHNMGLQHDGTASTGYYSGQGSGATGWAPIMGVGYYQALVQWSKGEYAGANNVEDDYAVMQSNGLPLRADDHGNTAGTATPIASGAAVLGVIERPTDIDYFSFSASAGALTLNLAPAARSANLDALVTLRNAAGTVLATVNPADALNATLSYTLPASGTYTVSVQGTGKGDPLTTGYTNYGSIGQYALTVSYPASTSQPPVARIAPSATSGTAAFTVSFSGSGSSDADGTITGYDWTFGDGSTANGVSASHTYTAAGAYTAQLRVTDSNGLSSTSTVGITVTSPVAVAVAMRVADIAMSLDVSAKQLQAKANAAVKVVDANGLAVAGATVTGNWSGLVSQTGATATTDTSGIARFSSPQSRKSGTFVFSVTGASRSGYSYTPATNTETSDSITK